MNSFVKETETCVQDFLRMITPSHYMIDSNLRSQTMDAVFSHWSFLRFGDDYVESESATVEQLFVHGALVMHSCTP